MHTPTAPARTLFHIPTNTAISEIVDYEDTPNGRFVNVVAVSPVFLIIPSCKGGRPMFVHDARVHIDDLEVREDWTWEERQAQARRDSELLELLCSFDGDVGPVECPKCEVERLPEEWTRPGQVCDECSFEHDYDHEHISLAGGL